MVPVFLTLCFQIFSSLSEAATFYVSTSGSDSNSCASASFASAETDQRLAKRNIMGANGGIACLKTPKDKLLVRGGTYDEEITNRNGQNFPPAPASSSKDEYENAYTVAAYKDSNGVRETVTLTRGMGFGDCCQNAPLPQMSYWIFDGFHLVSSDRSNNGLIYNQYHVDHLRFSNMEITNNYATNAIALGDFSATLGNTTGNCLSGGGTLLEFVDVEIHHCGAYGVYFTGNNTLFDRIKMHDTYGYGFHLYHYGAHDVNNVTVRNSEVYNIRPAIPTGTYPGHGILLASGDGSIAYNNIVRNSGGGIGTGNGATNSKIYNNTTYNNTGGGITVTGASNVIVKNNISYNNAEDAYDCGSDCGVNWTEFSNNLCSNYTYQYSRTLCTKIADPKFVNAAGNNFHLQSGSPAINAGVTLSEVLNDREGVARPIGLYDIGAYEFISEAQTPPRAPSNLRVQ